MFSSLEVYNMRMMSVEQLIVIILKRNGCFAFDVDLHKLHTFAWLSYDVKEKHQPEVTVSWSSHLPLWLESTLTAARLTFWIQCDL